MKTNTTSQRGGVLFATLLVISVIGIVIVGYLSLVSQRSSAVARSKAWNLCVPVAEAGLEEAIAHLNQTKGRSLVTNGWQATALGVTKTFTMRSGRYDVQMTNSGVPPAESLGFIESRGIVTVPGSSAQVTRRFRVTTRFRPELRGIVATDRVTIADLATADSYDSRVAPYNPLAPGDNTFIGNNSTMSGQMEISGTAKIYGDVGCGSATGLNLSSPAVVGDTAFVTNPLNGGRVETGHYTDNLNAPISAVQNPFTGNGRGAPAGGAAGSPPVPYTYLLSGGNYKVNGSLVMDASKNMMVTEDSTLWVSDTVTIKDSAKIIIAPGKRLKLYMEKQFYAMDNAQINANGLAEQFSYYGLTSNAQFYMSGFSIFNGSVYAPQAKMDISGNAQLFGGGCCSELVMKGSSKYHFDEALANSKEQPFLITSWSEL